jgi:hypothetical protein
MHALSEIRTNDPSVRASEDKNQSIVKLHTRDNWCQKWDHWINWIGLKVILATRMVILQKWRE